MNIIIIILVLLLTGCSSKTELLKGKLYYDRQIVNNDNELIQEIKLKEKEFYRITYRF